MSASIFYDRREPTTQQLLTIFEIVGDLRTTEKDSCHDRSVAVQTRLTERGYERVYLLGVSWKGADHVCTILTPPNSTEQYCVDVTIAQFPQLYDFCPRIAEGVVFIGPKVQWLELLGAMFGSDFEGHSELVRQRLGDLEMWLFTEAGNEPSLQPSTPRILGTATDHQVKTKVRTHKTGCCIIF